MMTDMKFSEGGLSEGNGINHSILTVVQPHFILIALFD